MTDASNLRRLRKLLTEIQADIKLIRACGCTAKADAELQRLSENIGFAIEATEPTRKVL